MRILVYLFAVIVLTSCCNNVEQKDNERQVNNLTRERTPIRNKKYIHLLIDSAINQGSASAYNLVASYYILEAVSEEFLYTALTVANKYNNAEACYHVFAILDRPRTGGNYCNLDNKTKNLAMFYLLRSYEMGFESAEYEVKEIFLDKTVPKASFYLKQYVLEMEKSAN